MAVENILVEPRSISYTLQFRDIILNVKVTTEKSKVKSMPHHDVAPQPLSNDPTKYEVPIQFLRYSPSGCHG